MEMPAERTNNADCCHRQCFFALLPIEHVNLDFGSGGGPWQGQPCLDLLLARRARYAVPNVS